MAIADEIVCFDAEDAGIRIDEDVGIGRWITGCDKFRLLKGELVVIVEWVMVQDCYEHCFEEYSVNG